MSAQGFVDPYDYTPYSGEFGVKSYNTQAEADAAFGKEYVSSGNSIIEKLGDALGLSDTKARYEAYMTERDRAYERAATNSARAWDEYMDSTKVQRLVNDIKAAGLNPWLAVQSGLSGGTASTTAGQGSSARYQSTSRSSKGVSDNIKNLALGIMATAKIFALLG